MTVDKERNVNNNVEQKQWIPTFLDVLLIDSNYTHSIITSSLNKKSFRGLTRQILLRLGLTKLV